MQVAGNSVPIQRNPPVELLSTCTVLLGLILICTLCSRGRLTLPTITSSPRVMAAVVINISARAFPPHVITQTIVTAAAARISFASMAIPCIPSECQIRSLKPTENKGATTRTDQRPYPAQKRQTVATVDEEIMDLTQPVIGAAEYGHHMFPLEATAPEQEIQLRRAQRR
jgi:hypothetical protein